MFCAYQGLRITCKNVKIQFYHKSVMFWNNSFLCVRPAFLWKKVLVPVWYIS